MYACSSLRSALALVLVLAGMAGAQITYPPLSLREAGTEEQSAASYLNFDGGDFDMSCDGVGCTMTLGPNAVINNGGDIGASADFEATVDLGSKVLLLPSGTADRAGTCTTGEFYLESDDSGTSLTGASVCRTTNTWAWLGDIVSGGLSGGQTIRGGTAAADDLQLQATAATSGVSGAIELCAGNPTMATGGVCATVWEDGVTLGGTTSSHYGVLSSGTAIEPAASDVLGLPLVGMFRDETRLKLQDSALNATYMGSVESFRSSVKIENATDDNVTAGGGLNGYIGFYASPELVKSSSGTLTLGTGFGFYSAPNTIDSGETIGNYYGFRAVSPTNNGTLTHNYGVFASTITGANRHPYSAGQGAITGSTQADEGDWGVEDTAPTRFYYRGDTGHIWRMGYMTMTGITTGLATAAGTNYGIVQGTAADNTTETSIDVAAPGAIKVYAMSCGLEVAAGAGSDAHAITLRDDAADTALSCTITTTGTNCQDREEAGVTIAAPSLLSWKIVSTDTPTANAMNCVIVYNLTAW
jgi:hypothetical protein